MKTEVLYNATKTERYRLTKIWDESKDIYSLLMIQAGTVFVKGERIVKEPKAVAGIRTLAVPNYLPIYGDCN